MLTVLVTVLFVEENRQMEAKHSLADTHSCRMPQTSKKRWVHLKFLRQKYDVTHFIAWPYFVRQRQQVTKQEIAPKPTISTLWELAMLYVCFRRRFRNELCNAERPEMLKKGLEFEASLLFVVGGYFDRHPNLYTQTYRV